MAVVFIPYEDENYEQILLQKWELWTIHSNISETHNAVIKKPDTGVYVLHECIYVTGTEEASHRQRKQTGGWPGLTGWEGSARWWQAQVRRGASFWRRWKQTVMMVAQLWDYTKNYSTVHFRRVAISVKQNQPTKQEWCWGMQDGGVDSQSQFLI